MSQTLFLITNRSGSSFIRIILAASGRKDCELPTTPPSHYFPEEFCPGKHIIADFIQQRDVTSPEIYSIYAGAEWGSNFYNSLRGNSWKFIYLLRDPRNRAASMMEWGQNKGKSLDEKNQIIQRIAEDTKVRAKALASMKNDARFKIFYFENLAVVPKDELQNMFSFAGLQISEPYLDSKIEEWKSRSNSSFQNDQQVNDRWHNWTADQVELFKSIAYNEILSMGYSW